MPRPRHISAELWVASIASHWLNYNYGKTRKNEMKTANQRVRGLPCTFYSIFILSVLCPNAVGSQTISVRFPNPSKIFSVGFPKSTQKYVANPSWENERERQCSCNNTLYFVFQLQSGPGSKILESDWPIARAPAIRIIRCRPRLRTAPKFPKFGNVSSFLLYHKTAYNVNILQRVKESSK